MTLHINTTKNGYRDLYFIIYKVSPYINTCKVLNFLLHFSLLYNVMLAIRHYHYLTYHLLNVSVKVGGVWQFFYLGHPTNMGPFGIILSERLFALTNSFSIQVSSVS